MPPRQISNSDAVLQFNGFAVVMRPEELRDKVLTAIIKAILHDGNNTPRTAKEVANIIMANEYTHLGGQTPHATISSRISTHFKKVNESRGARQALLGRLASESNTRKIKYYVDQYPFEPCSDDYTIVMRAEEPAKPSNGRLDPNSTAVRSEAAVVTAPASSKKRVASESSLSVKRKKVSAQRKKAPSRRPAESDSEIDNSDAGDIQYEQRHWNDDSSGEALIEEGQHKLPLDESILENEGVTNEFSSDESDSEISSIEEDDNEQGEYSELLVLPRRSSVFLGHPPQNPQQTYAFSPVFQPHIFIRPNANSLPPLSTLQTPKGAFSHLSPPLITNSSPVPGPQQHHGQGNIHNPSRILIPSPILLPSPRVLAGSSSGLSPSLATAGASISSIHPLDLGPGIYSSSQRSHGSSPGIVDSNAGNSDKSLQSANTILHPEAVSVHELEEMFGDQDDNRQAQGKSGLRNKRKRNQQKRPSVSHPKPGTIPLSLVKEPLQKVNPPASFQARDVRRLSLSEPHSSRHTKHRYQRKDYDRCEMRLKRTGMQDIIFDWIMEGPHIDIPTHRIILKLGDFSVEKASNEIILFSEYARINSCFEHTEMSAQEMSQRLKECSGLPFEIWFTFLKCLIRMCDGTMLKKDGLGMDAISSDLKETVTAESGEDVVDAALSLIGLCSPVLTGEVKSIPDDIYSGSFVIRVVATEPISATELLAVNLISNVDPDINGIWLPIGVALQVFRILRVPEQIVTCIGAPWGEAADGSLHKVSSVTLSSIVGGPRRMSSSASTAISSLDSNSDYLIFDELEGEENIEIGTEGVVSAPLNSVQDGDAFHSQFLPAINIDPSTLTLIPASDIQKALMWMTTIDGVFVYITWVQQALTSNSESLAGIGIPVLRRVDNGFVNASMLLHAGGLCTEREKSVILSLERVKKRYRRPESALRGTWIPLSRARELSRTMSLEDRLDVFLSDDAGKQYFGIVGGIRSNPLGGSMATPSPLKRKKGIARLTLGVDGAMRLGGVFGSGRKLRRGYDHATNISASTSSLESISSIGSSIYSEPLTLDAPKSIYPPGSLADIAHRKELEREAQKHTSNESLAASAVGNTAVGASPPENEAESAVQNPPAATASGDTDDGRTAAEAPDRAIIAEAESATKQALTSLANTLANLSRLNKSLTPVTAASTLAAFATGAKKINESVRSGKLSKAPSTADILSAFVRSFGKIKSPDTEASELVLELTEMFTGSINFAGVSSVAVLSQIGSSLRSANSPHASENELLVKKADAKSIEEAVADRRIAVDNPTPVTETTLVKDEEPASAPEEARELNSEITKPALMHISGGKASVAMKHLLELSSASGSKYFDESSTESDTDEELKETGTNRKSGEKRPLPPPTFVAKSSHPARPFLDAKPAAKKPIPPPVQASKVQLSDEDDEIDILN